MPQGKLFTGMFELASQFPPSVNTSDDPAQLKPFESPSCYGVSSNNDGRLSTGSIPTGTVRNKPEKTIGGTVYDWLYNRLWLATATTLKWGAPYYDNIYFPHGLGKRQFDANILDVQPCFQNQLWVLTSGGSYFIQNAKSLGEEDFEATQYVQELLATNATYALTMSGVPVVSTTKGVFMWTGSKLVELTRPVRNSIGNFSAVAITSDYLQQKIIGTDKYAIDTESGKLYDYGTTGFRYTTRTLAQPEQFDPFVVNSIAISFELSSAGSATISWQSKCEDGDWVTQDDIEIIADADVKSRVEADVLNTPTSAHKFSFRLTALSSNVSIRSIHANVAGLAVEGASK
jgi:hypothetical protein